jgi:hypothetical protein
VPSPSQIPYDLACDLDPVLVGEGRRPTVSHGMAYSITIFLFYSCLQERLQVVGNQFDLPFSVCVVYTWLYFIMFVNNLTNLHNPFHIQDNVSDLVFAQWWFFKQVILAHMGIRTLN